MDKIRCAVAGATGVVGQTFLQLLNDHPNFQVSYLCASDARIGQELGKSISFELTPLPTKITTMHLDALDVGSIKAKNISVIFSALPTNIAKSFETEAAQQGIKIFSNAGAHRMDEDVPILIPEINETHLQLVAHQKKKYANNGFIVTNANCTTTGLCLALAPIIDLGLEELIVSSYQALSGAGYPGYGVIEMTSNCIPFIKGEERKVEIEVKKIFGSHSDGAIQPLDLKIFPHCVRVPTVTGHLISVHAMLKHSVNYDEILSRFQNYHASPRIASLPSTPKQPVIYTEDENRPQPRLDVNAGEPTRAKGMAVSVGRLSVSSRVVRFITLSNNIIRGAAGGSVQNAELAIKEGLL